MLGGLLFTAACQAAAPPASGPAPTGSLPAGSAESGWCSVWGTGPDAAEQCGHVIEDGSRRTRITESQRDAAQSAYEPIERVVRRYGECSTEQGRPCQGVRNNREPTPADAEHLTRDLEQAGYRDFVVRVARRSDPAPEKSLLWAFKLNGDACVIGYTSSVPAGPGGLDVTGPLPDGRCLA